MFRAGIFTFNECSGTCVIGIQNMDPDLESCGIPVGIQFRSGSDITLISMVTGILIGVEVNLDERRTVS